MDNRFFTAADIAIDFLTWAKTSADPNSPGGKVRTPEEIAEFFENATNKALAAEGYEERVCVETLSIDQYNAAKAQN